MRDWDTPAYRAAEAVARRQMWDAFPEVELSVSCRAGWLPLVERFLSEAKAVLPEGERIEGLRAKEKMGALFLTYWYISDPLMVFHSDIWDIERRVEQASWHTCEVCGAPGVLRCDRGYYLTRCDGHAEGAEPWKPDEDG